MSFNPLSKRNLSYIIQLISIPFLVIGYSNPLIYSTAYIYFLYFLFLSSIGRIQLGSINIIVQIYISLALILAFIVFTPTGNSTLSMYLILYILSIYLVPNLTAELIERILVIIIISFLTFSIFNYIQLYFDETGKIAIEYNNVIAAYSIIPFAGLFLIKKYLKFKIISAALILMILFFSVSKTGWLILIADIFLLLLISTIRMKLLFLISIIVIGFIFLEEINQTLEFKLLVSGLDGESKIGHFWDRYDIFKDVINYSINSTLFEMLFGFSFIYSNNSDAYYKYSNSGYFHSSYLEVFGLGGFTGLIILILMNFTIYLVFSRAFNEKKIIFYIYFIYCFTTLNLTSNIYNRYLLLPLFFIICNSIHMNKIQQKLYIRG
jgi:hypothetical protein